MRHRVFNRISAAYKPLIALLIFSAGLFVMVAPQSSSPAQAAAGINKQINYQGRLMTATGATVADGNYNMRFKIYQDGPGNVAGDTGGTLKWTEQYQNNTSAEGVVVKNGYFSVSLGTFCAFDGSACTGGQTQAGNVAIDFNQSVLWLSVDIGGTTAGAPTYDGEMLPMKRMASAVYALQAGTCTTCILQAPTSTAQNTITPTTNSVTALTVNGTSGTAATAVSIVQAGAATNLALSNTAATSQSLLTVTQSTSAYTGTAILVNAAAGSGTFASGAFLDLQANGTSKFKIDNLGAITLAGAQAADITTLAGTAPTALVFQPGNNTTATSTGASFTLQAGNDSGATAATGGLLTLKGGNATGGSQTGGGVTIDSGTGTTGGAISIGTTSANSVGIGRSTKTTTVNGALTVSELSTFSGAFTSSKTLTVNSGSTQNVGNITFTSPADSSGTNISQALNISPTIGNATAGTNTANLLNIGAVTGDAQVTLNAINIGALTGTTAAENAINIGANWDSALSVGGSVVINGSGVVVATAGGTGQTTYAVGDLLTGDTGNTISKIAAVATGSCLISQGVTTKPIWGACAGLSLGTYSTSNTDAHGATLSAGVLTFQDASVNAPGMVGTATQSFVGSKTFTTAATAGGIGTLTVSPGAHTAVIAEVNNFKVNSNTETITGAVATQRFNLFNQNTITAASALAVTDAATVAIAGAPIKAGSATITNSSALLIQAGAVSTATNSYGINVNAQTGATNNYAAIFQGGNVGIGTATPTANLQVKTQTNTTMALQVLTSSGTEVVTADTVNQKVDTLGDINIGTVAGTTLVSDGFESGAFGNWTATETVGAGTITADTTHVRTGIYAAKVSTANTTSADVNKSITATSYIHARGYYYFASAPGGNVNLLSFYNNTTGYATSETAIYFASGTGKIGVWRDATGTSVDSPVSLPTGRWFQLDTYLTIGSGTSGAIQVYIDGQQVQNISQTNTGTPQIDRVVFGQKATNGGTGTYWMDDVYADTGVATGSASLKVTNNLQVGGGIAAQGSFLEQSVTNSTAAFQIQNASGTEVVTADTSNSKLVVRSDSGAASIGTELLTGNCSGTNWSGTGSGPYTHTAGSSTALTCTISGGPVSGSYYQIIYTTSGMTGSDYITPTIGSDTGSGVNSNTTNVNEVLKAFGSSNPTFTINSSSTASITSISYKLLTTNNSAFQVNDNTNTSSFSVQASNDFYSLLVGNLAGQAVTSGVDNTAVGTWALLANTTGSDNTAIGLSSLGDTTTGNGNSAVGSYAMWQNTIGSYNSVQGQYSMQRNVTGSKNAAIGAYALEGNSSGSFNSALGYDSLASNTTGTYNSSLGYYSGNMDSSGLFATSSGLTNATTIGAYAQVQASNSIVLGSIDTATKVGIGTTIPTNTLSVSPMQYNAGTAGTGGVSSATVTGVGTTWTGAYVGSEFIFSDGTKRNITAVGSTTSLTLSSAVTEAAGQSYRIHLPALQVTSAGKVGIGTTVPDAALSVITAGGSNAVVDIYGVNNGVATDYGVIQSASVGDINNGALRALVLQNNGGDVGVGNGFSSSTLPTAALHIRSSAATNLLTVTDSTASASDVLNIADGGAITLRNQTDSTAGLKLQNAAGTQILVVDTTNGRVGIGNITPGVTLDVTGIAAFDNDVTVDSNANGDCSGGFVTAGCDPLRFGSTISGQGIASNRGGSVNVQGMDFYTNSVARMSITNGGNVGIGTQAATTSFQIQNTTSGGAFLSADSTADASNLVTNGSFETNTTGWTARAGCTLTRDTTSGVWGTSSGLCTNAATANAGMNYNYTVTASTNYAYSFYARTTTSSFSTFVYGYATDGSTETNIVSSAQTLTTNWGKFTGTLNWSPISGTPYFFFKDTAGGHNIEIDGFKLELGTTATPYQEGRLRVDGVISSPLVIKNAVDSPIGLAVISSTNYPAFTVNTNTDTVGIGTSIPTSILTVSGYSPSSSSGNGTAATTVLTVTGGKGGTTTGTTGQTGGAGSAINITSGAGGDAPSGSTNGTGGDITIQGGAPGSGAGTANVYGDIIMQNAGGFVGIGTASPLAKLSVGSGSLSDVNVPIQLSTGGAGTLSYIGVNKNGGYGLLLGYENASTNGTGAIIRNATTDPLMFLVNNTTNAMTILSGGNVGIGNTSPGSKLQVNGDTQSLTFTLNSGSNPAIVLQNAGGTDGYLAVATSAGSWSSDAAVNDIILRSQNNLLVNTNNGGASALKITTSGVATMGLSTSSLTIADNGHAAGALMLGIGDDSFLADEDIANTTGLLGQQDNTKGCLQFGNNTAGFICGNNGNLGIGTTSSTHLLTIAPGGGTISFGGGSNTSPYALNVSVDDSGVNISNNSTVRGYNVSNGNGNLFVLQSGGRAFFPGLLQQSSGGTCTVDYSTTSKEIFCLTSSIRYKTNVQPLDNQIPSDFIYDINPVAYQALDPDGGPPQDFFQAGVIAEQVETAMKARGIDPRMFVQYDDKGRVNGFNYDRLVIPIVEELNKARHNISGLQENVTAAAEQLNSGAFDHLTIAHDVSIGGNLTVAGTTQLTDLKVSGSEEIMGSLSVSGNITTLDITVNGHIVTGGNTPATSVLNAAGANATVSITGNDTSGTIIITTGDPGVPASGGNPAIPGPVAGELAKITFAKAYGKIPHILIAPSDSGTAGIIAYPGSRAVDSFTLGLKTTPQPNTTYSFEYFITQ